MGKIEDDLVIRVGVNGGHGAALDLEVIMHDFGNGSQTICRARSIGKDVMFGGIVHAFIDAHHNGDVFVGCGRRDNDLLHRTAQVLARILSFGKSAGRFHHDLRAHGLPIQLGRVLFGKDADLAAINADAVALDFNIIAQIAKDGVILEQVRQGTRIGEIVDRHELQIVVLKRGTQNIASDAAKTVYSNFNCHSFLPGKIENQQTDKNA